MEREYHLIRADGSLWMKLCYRAMAEAEAARVDAWRGPVTIIEVSASAPRGGSEVRS